MEPILTVEEISNFKVKLAEGMYNFIERTGDDFPNLTGEITIMDNITIIDIKNRTVKDAIRFLVVISVTIEGKEQPIFGRDLTITNDNKSDADDIINDFYPSDEEIEKAKKQHEEALQQQMMQQQMMQQQMAQQQQSANQIITN